MSLTSITEAEAERLADAIVMRRIVADSAYVNAEDAEAQSAREAEIGAEVWRELESRYTVD